MDRIRTLSLRLFFSSHPLCVGFLFFFMFLCASVHSQTLVSIRITSGQVAVPNMMLNVSVCGKAKTLKSDADGRVNLKLNQKETQCDEIKVSIRSKFYQNLDTLLYLNSSTNDYLLDLHEKSLDIAPVEVVAYRPMAKNNAEKSVYTIDMRSLLKTTRANKALEYLPGVVAFENNYTLVGKNQQARIKINGVLASAAELKALYAKDIERVEVREITKDDNDRYAGEINIVKKRQEQPKIYGRLSGTVGSLHSLVGTFDNFGFQNKKWDITAIAGYTQHSQNTYVSVQRTSTSAPNDKQSMSVDRDIRIKQKTLQMAATWFPTSRFTWTLGAYHAGYPTTSAEDIIGFDGYNSHRNYTETLESYGAYTNASYAIKPQHKINVKGNFYYYRDKYNYALMISQNSKAAMREYTGEVNTENRIKLWGSSHDVVLGLRNTYRQNMSYVLCNTQYSIQQVYLSDFHSYSKAFSSYLILKGETDNLASNRTWFFQPALRLNYNMSKSGTLTFSYQHRVTRPSIDYLNGDTVYQSVYNKIVGNENLKAQSNDEINFSYRRQIGRTYLITTVGYTHMSNIIDQIFVTPNRYDVATYENVGQGNEYSVSAYLMTRLFGNRMNLSVNLKGFYKQYNLSSEYEDQTLIVPSSGWGYAFTANISYLSSKQWMYSLSANYNPKTYSMSTITTSNPSIYMSIAKSICHNKIDLRLGFTNTLAYFCKSYTDYNFRNMSQRSMQKLYSNNITFTVGWNFGKRFNPRRVTGAAPSDDIVTKQR